MSDLIEFLRARLDEDSEAARAAMINSGGEWAQVDPRRAPGRVEDTTRGYVVVNDDGWTTSEQATHIARHDPARVLAEVEAKRRAVDRYAWLREHGDAGDATWVLPLLAAVYADRPDYQPEWAPTA